MKGFMYSKRHKFLFADSHASGVGCDIPHVMALSIPCTSSYKKDGAFHRKLKRTYPRGKAFERMLRLKRGLK